MFKNLKKPFIFERLFLFIGVSTKASLIKVKRLFNYLIWVLFRRLYGYTCNGSIPFGGTSCYLNRVKNTLGELLPIKVLRPNYLQRFFVLNYFDCRVLPYAFGDCTDGTIRLPNQSVLYHSA